ncbi:MAG TPA: hypothetical protein VN033_04585 [Vulgatibacter sp.]|nr:hypothetical protein [Vulgatibacter sp.]
MDLPFYELKQPDEPVWNWRTGETKVREGATRYVVPMTFGVTYLWW